MIREIFEGSELTVQPDQECYLNKYHSKRESVRISYKTFILLLQAGYLEEFSGNFDTGEIHYIYTQSDKVIPDSVFDELKVILRHFKLKSLLN